MQNLVLHHPYRGIVAVRFRLLARDSRCIDDVAASVQLGLRHHMACPVEPGFVDVELVIFVEVANVKTANQHRRFICRERIAHDYVCNCGLVVRTTMTVILLVIVVPTGFVFLEGLVGHGYCVGNHLACDIGRASWDRRVLLDVQDPFLWLIVIIMVVIVPAVLIASVALAAVIVLAAISVILAIAAMPPVLVFAALVPVGVVRTAVGGRGAILRRTGAGLRGLEFVVGAGVFILRHDAS